MNSLRSGGSENDGRELWESARGGAVAKGVVTESIAGVGVGGGGIGVSVASIVAVSVVLGEGVIELAVVAVA